MPHALRLSSLALLLVLSRGLPAQQFAPVAVAPLVERRPSAPSPLAVAVADDATRRRIWKSGLKGALIGGVVGAAAALWEGAQGQDCTDLPGCGRQNHPWRYIGVGVGAGAMIGVISALPSK